jgi:aspartate kinase
MLVFKFGGASVKDAEAVRNLGRIVQLFNKPKIIVVSAMAKTTAFLERLFAASREDKESCIAKFNEIKDFHLDIATSLFSNSDSPVFLLLNEQFDLLEKQLNLPSEKGYDFEYDQIVSYGEIWSTIIISEYLKVLEDIDSKWVDIRKCIVTDSTYREGKIKWSITEKNCNAVFDFSKHDTFVTQGFIGSDEDGFTTTLGKEGSDFTAAIIANALNAENVTIWKDVPGVLNADPKWFSNTKKLDNISYKEAVELAYYGATIIHPKTLKPLENKKIPLYVKSFIEPELEGTCIDKNQSRDELIPSFIFRMNQVLISFVPRDLSFIMEDNLSEIFGRFAELRMKINLMQNSAVNFSVCVDYDKYKLDQLMLSLKDQYKVFFNEGLELATIRHYNQPTIDRVLLNKKVYLEQKTRHTARFVIKDILN